MWYERCRDTGSDKGGEVVVEVDESEVGNNLLANLTRFANHSTTNHSLPPAAAAGINPTLSRPILSTAELSLKLPYLKVWIVENVFL